MQPKLHSPNALAVELRRDRRSLARDLADLKPAKVEQRGSRTLRWYYLADVIEHLYLPAAADEGEYDDQRQRLAAAQAEKVETDNALRRGELAWMPDVHKTFTDLIANARARLLRLPTDVAAAVPPDQRPAALSASRKAVYEALTELAKYPGE